MNYALDVPSLQRLAAIRIAVMLWNHDDTRALITRNDIQAILTDEEYGEEIDKTHHTRKMWQMVEDYVKKKGLGLFLPGSLKKIIIDFIHPLGLQILNWGTYHELYFNLSVRECMDKLRWTPHGTVDEKQTAEQLIMDKNLSVVLRYKLACVYCLEDHVSDLWKQLTQKEFHGKDLQKIKRYEPPSIVYWSHFIEGNVAELHHWSPDISAECIFDSARTGNRTAIAYFIEKLTAKEKQEIADNTVRFILMSQNYNACDKKGVPPRYYTEILCLLLSFMDEKQLLELFKMHSSDLLVNFLVWPWQDKFTEILHHVQSFLNVYDFYEVLLCICKIMKYGYADYDYHSLFEIFWQQSPNTYKKFAIGYVTYYRYEDYFLSILFESGSKRSINLVFEELSAEEKRNFIFSYRGNENMERFREKWISGAF